VTNYRFPEATRKNSPPAKIAAEGHVPIVPKAEYGYSLRRPPELRFDPTGRTDELPELLATAGQRKLTEAEVWALAGAAARPRTVAGVGGQAGSPFVRRRSCRVPHPRACECAGR
jgi:hypothetical protein